MRSPRDAPPRPDLGWLRHRALPRPSTPTRSAGDHQGEHRIDYDHHGIDYAHHHGAAPSRPSPAASSAPSRPSPAASSAPSRPSGPSAPSLDLTDLRPPERPTATPSSRAQPDRRRHRTLPYRRLPAGTSVVLAGRQRSVTLTRLQSGVGTLQLSLVRAAAAGDLALGLVCATTDGAIHVLQRLGDALSTPATPLSLARLTGAPGSETCLLDLRQVRSLSRAMVYAYGPDGSPPAWEGVLRVATHDGSRVEVPFDLPGSTGTLVLLTAYVVHGEVVLRAELDLQPGPQESAAEAYGYQRVWLDGRLPVT